MTEGHLRGRQVAYLFSRFSGGGDNDGHVDDSGTAANT